MNRFAICPNAPAPNRRPRFPLGGLVWFEYVFCAPPASTAAVGEARRSAETCAQPSSTPVSMPSQLSLVWLRPWQLVSLRHCAVLPLTPVWSFPGNITRHTSPLSSRFLMAGVTACLLIAGVVERLLRLGRVTAEQGVPMRTDGSSKPALCPEYESAQAT